MSEDKEILNNRQAYHEFFILDKYEAGAALVGTEVKSIMAGRIQLKEAFVQIKDGEVWLLNSHISHYSHGNINNHDVLRPRKLLLHRREIDKLEKAMSGSGRTIVPLALYFLDGYAKVELAVGTGKKAWDKRQTIAERDANRDAARELATRNRGE